MVTKDQNLEAVIGKIRTEGQAVADRLKKTKLPYVTPAGAFTKKRSMDYFKLPSHIFMLDLDNITDPESMKQQLVTFSSKDPHIVIAFVMVSPKGGGLKVGIYYDQETYTDNNSYKALYKSIQAYFEIQFAVNADDLTCAVSTACLISYDPDAFINLQFPDPEELEKLPEEFRIKVDHLDQIEEGALTEKDCPWPESSRQAYMKKAIEGIDIKQCTHEPKRLHYPELSRLSFKFLTLGITFKNTWAFLEDKICPHSTSLRNHPAEDVVRELYRNKKYLFGIKYDPDKVGYGEAPNVRSEGGSIAMQVNQDVALLMDILNERGARFNTISKNIEIGGTPINGDREMNGLYLTLEFEFNRRRSSGMKCLTKNRFWTVINNSLIPDYDPLKMLVEETDIVQRGHMAKWCSCIKTKTRPEFLEKYVTKFLVAMVAQVLSPVDIPNEWYLALLGEQQGEGKTRVLKYNFLPSELDNYVSFLKMNAHDKDYQMALCRFLLLIDDEMDGKTLDDEKAFKGVTSLSRIDIREPYARSIRRERRIGSLAGTGNVTEFIKELRNRRIIPIEIVRVDFEAINQVDRVAMLQEAYQLWKEGFEYWYNPKTDFEELNAATFLHKQNDPLREVILERLTPKEDGKYFSSTEIGDMVQQLMPSIRNVHPQKVGQILGQLEFPKRRPRTTKGRVPKYGVCPNSRLLIDIEQKNANGY